MRLLSRPHLVLIALVGVIVPRRLRADWREEWEAELQHREALLADWDRLDRAHKWELLRRSTSAFWDALWLQRQRWEDDVVQDIRFALRLLARTPMFTGVAVVTLALGIGTNTAIFSVVNALLLRPLDGVSDPARLVRVSRQYADRAWPSDSTYPDFLDYQRQSTTMSGLSIVVPTAFDVRAGEQTERVDGELVSSNYFDVLGVSAARGRLIAPTDDRDGNADDVAVVSYRAWQRWFGGDPGAVGSTIQLNGRSFAIVGIAAQRFTGARIGMPRDVWIPILTLRHTDPAIAIRLEQRRASWVEMFGRLKPNVTIEQAQTELSSISARLELAYPNTNAHARARLDPGVGRDVEVEQGLRQFTYLPFTAAMLVLLIACANVAGLLLGRAVARKRELATRLAIGAGRLRIVRQLLTESAVLALTGGAAGLVVGSWLTGWLRSLLPDRYLFLAFDMRFGVDWRVFVFTLGIATATGLLFGVLPAVHASRPDLVASLKAARGSRGGGFGTAARGTLVIVQVALSLMLLVAAGLCVKTLRNAAAIDTGYDVNHVLTARLALTKQRYDKPRGLAFQRQLIERIEAIPGVDAAAFAVTLPLNDGRWENPVYRAGDKTRVQTFQNVVSTRYFDALDIPLVAGRRFRDADDDRSARVAIVNQRLARIMWPDRDPVGEALTFKGDTLEVVGVVHDIKGRNLFEAPGPMLYLPLAQDYQSSVVLHIRARASTADLAPMVQREVQALDKDLPLYNVKTLDDHFAATLTPQRLLAYLTSSFSALALLLSVIGLYGLLSYAVTERTSEIGVRVALGASRIQIVRLFLSQGVVMASGGIALGLAAAFASTRLMASVLFGVSPLDPLTMIAAPTLLIVVALLASYVPARRAARSDPNVALRYE